MTVKLSGQKILVTGGAGFIGSNLVKSVAAGNIVVVVDDLSEGHVENLDALPPAVRKNVTFVRDDVRNYDLMEKLFTEHAFDYVFHFAASFANQKSIDFPVQDLDINGMATLHLLQLAHKHAPKLKRFTYAGSSCVYGPSASLMTETDRPMPDTPYAITKLLGEQYNQFYHDFHKMPTTTVRYFNVYGPNEYPGPYRNVIPKFMALARKGQPLTITGTGDETRDFTFVDDAVQGTLAAATNEKGKGHVFNIGAGQETPIKRLAEKVNAVANNKAKPGVVFKPRRDWDHITRRACNNAKAKQTLDWHPATTLDEGLSKTWAWFEKAVPV